MAGLSFFVAAVALILFQIFVMKFRLLCLLSILLLTSCQKDYNPDSHLSPQEQYDQVWKIIRFISKPPENLTFEERFYKGYNPYYEEQMKLHRLDAYFIENGIHYFLISRRAPSLKEKRVATGGRLKLNKKDEVISYEEVFRTWKMEDKEQIRRSLLLFDKMIKHESLEPYLTKNSKEEYIEFPDDHVVFDTTARQWKIKLLPDSLLQITQ